MINKIRRITAVTASLLVVVAFWSSLAYADELILKDLIDDALLKNPEILASDARVKASGHRIPQAGALSDPMFMFGYQNDGWERYTFGKMPDAKWMFSVSQMFPFPGKLPLKEEIARQDADSLAIMHEALKLRVSERIRQLYYDLVLAYKTIDLIHQRTGLFEKIEEAALARYSSGQGMQSDVLMAQTEKYMLLEKEEMQKQKIRSVEAMMNALLGRSQSSPLGIPQDKGGHAVAQTLETMLEIAYQHSPEIRVRQLMLNAAELRVKVAKKDFYPDFTLTAGYETRGGGQFTDMWSLQTTINLPIFYRSKQKQALSEAEYMYESAKQDLGSAKLMVESGLRDAYTMQQSADRLIDIYKNGLLPRAVQDFEAALALYSAGKSDAITAISRLKTLIDVETSYWVQYSEREKNAARFETMIGKSVEGMGK